MQNSTLRAHETVTNFLMHNLFLVYFVSLYILPSWLVSLAFSFTGCRSDARCCFPLARLRQTSLWSIWVHSSASSVHTDLQRWPYFFYLKISHSLNAVNVARRFGCFTASTAGRSDAPRCRRHFCFSVIHLPLGMLSSSPSLEVRRLIPVHLS